MAMLLPKWKGEKKVVIDLWQWSCRKLEREKFPGFKGYQIAHGPWPTVRLKNLTAHQVDGQLGLLLLRPMGSPLAKWVRPRASFYAHGYPMG